MIVPTPRYAPSRWLFLDSASIIRQVKKETLYSLSI